MHNIHTENVEYHGFLGSFGDLIWWFLSLIIIFAYIYALFMVIADLFRDKKLSGWWKAVWIVLLIFIPFITLIVYLIARGGSMTKRAEESMRHYREAQDEYIKNVAGARGPADQIAHAKQLLDAGTITQAEFDALKAKALQ